MYQNILKAFTGEFHVKSTPLVEHEKIIVSGVQTGTLVKDGKGIIARYTANQIDGVMLPIRMQGILTYNKSIYPVFMK